MKHADITQGMRAIVNGDGDLAMDGEVKPHIGKEVSVCRVLRGGMVMVKRGEALFQVPARNLDPVPETPPR